MENKLTAVVQVFRSKLLDTLATALDRDIEGLMLRVAGSVYADYLFVDHIFSQLIVHVQLVVLQIYTYTMHLRSMG